MAWLLVLVFSSVFGVLAMLLFVSGAGASQKSKQTLAHLESALATSAPTARDQILDIRKSELLSAVPMIHHWLTKLEVAPRLRVLLAQANLKWTAGGLLLMSFTFCFVFGYLAYLRAEDLVLSMGIGLLAGWLPMQFVLRKRRKRFEEFEQGLPEALDLMVSALRAGHSLVAALRLVAKESPDPLGGEFRICFEEQNYGLELRAAMENLVMRMPLQDMRLVATAILIQKESGGNLAEVLDKASYLIRERFKLRREILTHTAQGRLTGLILSLLPVILGVMLYFVDPDMIRVLWTRQLGLELMYAAGALTAVGGFIIQKIVNMEV